MKMNTIFMLAFLRVFAFGYQIVSAQFPLTIPKIPKISKDKKIGRKRRITLSQTTVSQTAI
jgi:hypothetical protein